MPCAEALIQYKVLELKKSLKLAQHFALEASFSTFWASLGLVTFRLEAMGLDQQ